MNTPIKINYFWSVIAGLTTYVLWLALMNQDLHPTTPKQYLTVFTFPLFPAIVVSGLVNLRSMKSRKRKYFLRMTIGMSAYVFGIWALNRFYQPNSPYKYWLVLLPLLPTIFVAASIVRAVTELDEMMRKIAVEAMAFAGIATGFTCFSYLFLRDMGAPEFHGEWAFYLVFFYYGIGTLISRRRYR